MNQIEDKNALLITEEGLKKLLEELNYLKTEGRKKIAGRLKEAISYGDLSENSEYEEAKNEQAFIEGRILELEEQAKHAKVIKGGKKGKTVQLGSKVEVKNISDGGIKEVFTIVGSTESDPLQQKISNESPVGGALLSQSVGDVVEVNVPAGQVKYEILKVS